mmetsp:Transcript_70195/g.106202  ORF Transcript_70195/g.106202 Transcript_70195/m.106202 type:complete len:552 (-) Transcript_70195:293-1948(-)
MRSSSLLGRGSSLDSDALLRAGAELVLGALLALDGGGEAVAVHGLEGAVDEVRARPLLVRQRVHALLALRALDALDVAEHRLLLDERAAEAVGVECRQVEPGERHKLPGEAQLPEVLAEGVHLLVCHPGRVPVERRRQVVRQQRLLAGAVHPLAPLRQPLRVRKDRLRRLRPHDVRVRREVPHPVDARVDARLQAEVALARARQLPVPERLRSAENLASERAGILVGDARELGVVLLPDLDLLGGSVGLGELLLDGLVEGHDAVVLLPRGHLLRALGVAVGARVLVGGALDEHVVAGVLVGLDQLRGLRVGARHDHRLRAHDVALQPRRHQPVDVLARRHQHLPAHVPALLRPVPLVLEVDPRRPRVHHALRQPHHRRHPAVPGVAVRDDRPQVVGAVVERARGPLRLELLAVVELLSAEEPVNVLRHRVKRVVGEVGARLVDGRVVRRRLPARDVDGLRVLDHLRELRHVEAAEGRRAAPLLAEVAHQLVQLRRHQRRCRPRPLHRSPKTRHVLRIVVAESALETIRPHPRLDLLRARFVRQHVPRTLVR